MIEIDIPARSMRVALDDAALGARRAEEEARGRQAFTLRSRVRVVSTALRAYAALATSASRRAVRDVDQVTRR